MNRSVCLWLGLCAALVTGASSAVLPNFSEVRVLSEAADAVDVSGGRLNNDAFDEVLSLTVDGDLLYALNVEESLSGDREYETPVVIAEGIEDPRAMRVGDADADFYDDVFVQTGEASIAFIANNFNGGQINFDPPRNVITLSGESIVDFQLVDADADDDQDIVVWTSSNALKLYINSGRNFPLVPETIWSQPIPLQDFVVGDVNRDGRKDIVAVTEDYTPTSGSTRFDVYVMANDGPAGTIYPEQLVVAGVESINPTKVYTGFIDNSLPPSEDILVYQGPGFNQLAIVRLDGDLANPVVTFQSLPLGVPPSNLVPTNVSGDADIDFMVMDFNAGVRPTYLVNTDDQGFQRAQFDFKAFSRENAGVVAFNGNNDGVPDMLIPSAVGHDWTVLHPDSGADALANGGTLFGNFLTVDGKSDQPMDIESADINGTGRSDLVVVSQLDGKLSIFYQDPFESTLSENGFFPESVVDSNLFGPATVALADLNDDGKVDIVLGDEIGGNILAYINTISSSGDTIVGSFNQTVVSFTVGSVVDMAIGDINGDNKPDIVTAQADGSVRLLQNNIGGAGDPWVPEEFIGEFLEQFTAVALADLDGDGDLDVVAGGAGAVFDAQGEQNTRAYWIENTSTEIGFSFAAPRVLAADTPGSVTDIAVALGDDDSDFDVFVLTGDNGIYVYENDGAGAFAASNISGVTGELAGEIVLADLTNDGVPDIAVTLPEANALRGYAGLGGLAYGEEQVLYSGDGRRSSPTSFVFGSFDDDEKIDLAVAHQEDDAIVVASDQSGFDFGDAPDSYQTLRENDGPFHRLSGLTIGDTIDEDADGQPDTSAVGDDVDAVINDEDAFNFGEPRFVAQGFNRLSVDTNGSPAGEMSYLRVWVDWDINGVFDHPSELIIDEMSEFGLTSTYQILAPEGIGEGSSFMRIRFGNTPDLLPTGFGGEGEVEDHSVVFTLPSLLVTTIDRDEGDEGTKAFEVELEVFPVVDYDVTVSIDTEDGTAIAGEDYISVSGEVTIPAGTDRVTAQVQVLGDTEAERDETYFVLLSSEDVISIPQEQYQITIRNDDGEFVDNPPVIRGDYSFEVDEDADPLTGRIDAVDAEGDELSYAVITPEVVGDLVIDEEGNYTYTLRPDANGFDSIRFRVSDSVGNTTDGFFDVTVNSVNDAPVLAAQVEPVTTIEDTAVFVPFTITDVDSDSVQALFTVLPPNGDLFNGPDSTVQYVPDANFFGEDRFTLTPLDPEGAEGEPQEFVVVVTPANDAPVIINSPVLIRVDEDDSIDDGQVEAVDPDNDAFVFSILEGPENGTASMTEAGVFSYSPNANFNGSDSFRFTATDGEGASAQEDGIVEITVNPVNDAPLATGDEIITTTSNPGSFQVTATDIDGDALTFVISTQALNGSVSINSSTGAGTYSADADFVGQDSFTVSAIDGRGGVGPAEVTVLVERDNTAPFFLQTTYSIATVVGESSSVALRASDNEDDALSFSVVDSPLNGTAAINTSGLVTYTPDVGFFGSDTFTVRVSDGSLDSSVQATINVTVEDGTVAPEIVGTSVQSILRNGSVRFTVESLDIADSDSSQFTVIVLAGEDYNVAGTTVTPANSASDSISVNLQVSDGENLSEIFVAVLNIVDQPVTFSVLGSAAVLREGSGESGALRFTVQADSPVSDDTSISMDLADLSGSNVPGSIFAPASVLIPSGEQEASFSLVAVSDGNNSGDRRIRATFSSTERPEVRVSRVFTFLDSSNQDNPDGVSAQTERRVGDGNDDGIADANQDNVASLFVNGGAQSLTVDASEVEGSLRSVAVVSRESVIDQRVLASSNVAVPDEIYQFSLEDVAPGSCHVVSLNFGVIGETSNVNRYFKFGPTEAGGESTIYDFTFDGTTGAQFRTETRSVDGEEKAIRIVDLTLCDGLRGDSDLTANGVIDDPGFALQGAAVPVSPPGTPDDDGDVRVSGSSGSIPLAFILLFFYGLVRRARSQ